MFSQPPRHPRQLVQFSDSEGGGPRQRGPEGEARTGEGAARTKVERGPQGPTAPVDSARLRARGGDAGESCAEGTMRNRGAQRPTAGPQEHREPSGSTGGLLGATGG